MSENAQRLSKPAKTPASRVVSLVVALMMTLVGLVTVPVAAHADPIPDDPLGLGRIGYDIPWPNGENATWLGTQLPRTESGDIVSWCVDINTPAPRGNEVVSVATLSDATPRVKGFELTTAQMAWILERHLDPHDRLTAAAISWLVHANFENATTDPADLAFVLDAIRANAPEVERKALELRAQAIKSGAVDYIGGTVDGDGQRKGSITGIAAFNDAGEYAPGVPVSMALNGPAIFDATGTNTWSGKTADKPLTLTWTATGNGEVTWSQTFKTSRKTLTYLASDGSVQDVITVGNRPASDPDTVTIPGPMWKVVYDFQPVGVSNVHKLTEEGAFTDTLDAQADKAYGSGQWLKIEGTDTFVPVTYKVSAYYVGLVPPNRSDQVPSDAKLLDTTTVTAQGPGPISADFTADKPGFFTVVWEVIKADQAKEYQQYIAADWADGYGITEETTSHRHEISIDSTATVRNTKSGTYLVDDLWVTGFPADHGSFTGHGRFGADESEMTQELLFFPLDLAVTDENADQAQRIASVTIPAKNGFYPSLGSTDFKARQNDDGTLIAGTYVFVTSFAGDDRVKPLRTSVTDVNEQFTITSEPSIHTTLMYEDTRLPVPATTVKLVDQVAYTNLTVGQQYDVEGVLMDKATGEPLVDAEGNKITASTSFVAQTVNGNVDVVFDVDGSLYEGKTTVAFETLYHDGKEIAVHADINDENQTLPFTKIRTQATDKADGDQIIDRAPGQTIVDVVCDESGNFVPGQTYTITATLVTGDGEPLVDSDGEAVTQTTQFTPASARDCARIEITFDASTITSDSVVVFESVYRDETLVGVHHDLTDAKQTVTFTPTPPTPPEPKGLPKTGAALGIAGALATSLLVLGTGLVLKRRRQMI